MQQNTVLKRSGGEAMVKHLLNYLCSQTRQWMSTPVLLEAAGFHHRPVLEGTGSGKSQVGRQWPTN